MAPYGVLANLLAMPIVSGWVMPMGILGVVALPFGFDGVFWRQMGYGIEWMDFVALWVAGLPGCVRPCHLVRNGTGAARDLGLAAHLFVKDAAALERICVRRTGHCGGFAPAAA
jgi:competence protein ComEC